MLVGLAIFAAASLVSAVLSDPLIVIVSRGLAGAGAALIMPATLSLITAGYSKEERNKAVGIWAGVAGSGAVIGMLGSGGLLNFWSWHSIFWAFAGAALTIFILTLTIASSRDTDAKPLDWRGALVIGGAVATLVFGILEAPARGWTHPLGVAGAGAALIMPATLSLITAAYPKDQRNKAVGIWAGVAGSGAVIGMLGSGGLLNFWSWHSIFWAFAGAALTILVLTLTIASSRDADVKPLDWRGALVIGGAVATLVFGILEAPARGWTHPLVISASASDYC